MDEHDYSYEDEPPVGESSDGENDDVERELPWVTDLPEGDRRLFADEMAQLMAEAAETDDFAEVDQALREWRATAEVHADPILSRQLSGPRVANGGRVPRPAVSSVEGPPSADIVTGDEDDDVERELPWVADLPEHDRRLFADEMAQLMAEAAQTDDFVEVDQALREWRVTSLTYSDPELNQIFSRPLVANGGRVPRPVI